MFSLEALDHTSKLLTPQIKPPLISPYSSLEVVQGLSFGFSKHLGLQKAVRDEADNSLGLLNEVWHSRFPVLQALPLLQN